MSDTYGPDRALMLVPPVRGEVCRKCGETVRIWHVVTDTGSHYRCERCAVCWPIQRPESD